MRELTIGKNDAGQRVDRFVSKALPLLPPALLQKYIRLKRIKVNGGRAQRDQRLQEGDVLQLYINDEFFDKPREDNLFLTLFRPSLDIVYEDENLMLLNKRPGLVVHADETEKVNTLINHIQAYLYQKREWNPRWENAFTPALCNRIDRNTGGIVIAAKNAETLRIINQKIRDREIDKRYLCITVGAPRPPQGEVSCFLLKDEKKKGLFSDKNGNAYIIMYSTVMVVIVATLLAVAALSLQSRQYANELNEKKQSILSSLSAQGENYDAFIKGYVLDADGNELEGEDVFELLKDLQGAFDDGKFPVFEAADGRVVIPVTGMGLWGPVWGYVALEKDMNTVAGIIMAHKGETPGLGAEIATPKYQANFVGKTIFDGDKFVSVTLRKGGAKDPAHEVDAISGGTKTSDGVTAMLYNSLENYLPLLEAKRNAAAPAPAEVSNEENVENNE